MKCYSIGKTDCRQLHTLPAPVSLMQGSSVSAGLPFWARSLSEVWSLLAMAGGLEHPWTLPVLLLPFKEVITTADRSSHSIFIWGELGSESAQPELGAQDPHVPGALWHMRVPASILYP